jgi:outer membrane receptor protein involved in Fe transport
LTVPIFSGPRHVSSVLASLFVLAIVVACAACGQAQTTAAPATTSQLASVSGIATDAGGAALVGVTVTLTGPATLSTATDAKGAYTLTKVPPGMYGLAAMRGGFETAREGKVAVTAGTSLVVNVTLAALSLTTLRVIGQTSTEATRSHFNTSPAAVVTIPQSTFVDQGQLQVSRVLDETPGIVTGHASSAFPSSSGASPVALVAPSIRGGLPWETATFVDGHPVAVQGDGFYWLQSLNPYAISAVEVTKGPGASSPLDSDAINGSLNFRTLDPTVKPTASFVQGIDNYGGLFTTLLSRGTTVSGKLGWVFEYAVDGSAGPLQNYQAPLVTNIGTSPGGQTIGGYTVAANPYSAASPPPGIQNSYQGSKTRLVACCEALNSAYSSKTELAKLRYAFSPATSLTASFFGNQLYTLRDGYGTALLPTTFAPGAGYTGALARGAMTVSTGSYLPPGETLTNNEPMFNVEFRTTHKNDTVLARFYSDSINVDLSNGLSSANQSYSTVFQQVNGTLTTSTCPPPQKTCTVAFNGGPATAVFPGEYNATPVTSHLRGGSFEYDHAVGRSLYTIDFDDMNTTASWIKTSATYPGIGATYLVPVANYVIPPGSNEQQKTVLLRGYWDLPSGFAVTLGTYVNLYTNGFATTQTSAGIPENWTTQSFSHVDPRLGISYRLAPNISLRASAGASIAPPFLQLYQVSTAPSLTSSGVIYSPKTTTYAAFRNNPGLRPETAFGYNFGADIRLVHDPASVISGDVYLTNLWNQFFEAFIDSKTTYTNATSGTGELYYTQYQNLSQARYQGIELSLRRDPPRGFGFVAQGGLQQAYPYNLPASLYGSTGKPIANLGIVAGSNFVASNANGQTGGFNASAIGTSTISIPYSQGYAAVDYRFPRNSLVSLGTTYYGPNNSFGVRAFLDWNATARYGLDRDTTAQFSVDNLFGALNSVFITANGGVAVPLANGNYGLQNANAIGPRTFRFFVTRAFGG